jgi:cytoskeleton protein RodZ
MEAVTQNDPIESGSVPAPLPASAGAVLAAAREAKGLSIEDISRQLKLSAAQVRALETDDHASLPSPVFVRGFLRSYARVVGADITALLPSKTAPVTVASGAAAAQGERMLQQQSSAVMETRRKRPVMVALLILACLIAALSYYEFVINSPARPAVTAPESMTSAPAVPAAPAVNSVTVPVTPAVAEAPVTPPVQETAKSEPVAVEKSLHFVFKRDSWVEVLDGNDEVLFSQRNAAGSERRITGKPPFKLVVGAASSVELRFNGKLVDLLAHAPVTDVARLTLE